MGFKVSENFHAENGMVGSTYTGWIQSEFNIPTRIFDQVGLQTNVYNTVGMVCRPFQAAGVRADEAYTRRMTGEGRSFKEWQRERILFP